MSKVVFVHSMRKPYQDGSLFPKMLAQIDAEDVSKEERSDDNRDEGIIKVVWTNIGNVIQCRPAVKVMQTNS